MKKINSTLGIISVIVLIAGALMKISHIKYASIVLSLGSLGFLAQFIAYLILGVKPLTTILEKSAGITGGVTMCLGVIAFMLKAMHWPGAGVLIIVSQVGLLVTSILLIADSIKETDKVKQSIKTLFAFALMLLTVILFFMTQMIYQA